MNDTEFALEIRQIDALVFIPEEAVENAFKTLCESEFYENNELELTPFLNYFEDTWLGQLDRRGRRHSPLFLFLCETVSQMYLQISLKQIMVLKDGKIFVLTSACCTSFYLESNQCI
jgi:hypothetical protein